MIFDPTVNKEKVLIERELSFYLIVAYYNILKLKEKKQTNESIVVYFSFWYEKRIYSILFDCISSWFDVLYKSIDFLYTISMCKNK